MAIVFYFCLILKLVQCVKHTKKCDFSETIVLPMSPSCLAINAPPCDGETREAQTSVYYGAL